MNTLDKEFQALSSLDKAFKVSIEQLSTKNIHLKITIDKSLIKQKYIELQEDLRFSLYVKKNYPKSAPRIYCLSKFGYPEICDPRDLLEEILDEKWGHNNKYYHLKTIIKKIPQFIIDYIEDIQENYFYIGKFFLDDIYEKKILNLFPTLYFNDIYEKIYLENSDRYYDEARKLFISDGFFLMFVENNMFEREQLRLIFHAAIKSLIHIKHYTSSDIIELTWKVKGGRNVLMRIRSPDADKIVQIMMNILKKKSIKYKVTNKDFRQKEGELPDIKIDIIEEEINKYEVTLRLKENINLENVSYLMQLYEKAVQYYSAINDNKFELYKGKIQDMFNNKEYTELLNDKNYKAKDIDTKINKIYIEKNEKNNDKQNIKNDKKEEKKETKVKIVVKKDEKKEDKEGKKVTVKGNFKTNNLVFESDEDDD